MDLRVGVASPFLPAPRIAPRAAAPSPVQAGDRWQPSGTELCVASAPVARPGRLVRAVGVGLMFAATLCGLPIHAADPGVPVAAAAVLPIPRPAVPPSSVTTFPARTYVARGTAYYPHHSRREGGHVDMQGRRLRTLQDFLAGKATYVSVAMDTTAGLPYGSRLKIPELEQKYHRPIEFRVVDTGGDFKGTGTSRIDICVRNHAASLDSTINGPLTLIPQD